MKLRKHVEHMFKGYKENNQIRELKEEIVSNLEAKVADLTASGMSYDDAVGVAINNMGDVEELIEGNKKIWTNRFKTELLQVALLYAIVAWIVTLPPKIVGLGTLLNYSFLFLVVVLGALFLYMNTKKHESFLNKVVIYHIPSALRYKKMAWQIWWLFIGACILSTTAIHFASNIWFARPISLTGPYQFAVIGIDYALPFVSMIIPLLFSKSITLLEKYEVSE
ncbi:permease prefix domain 1-containing protein [Caldalkalibacillus mannanilyticus]|uniref:permease prefix domain 1-containing protein n=1 Tax=Caldalkalibacillus mannanilyticus TaxID=1418 RepID=UPI00046A4C94|nr:permease prefix domain 1-containing protein [Caldalkalibacillus mannanilyticus]